MSIASQIQDYKSGLMDAYDAVYNRGGTMPARCNMDSLATAINSIPSGGGGGGDLSALYRHDNGAGGISRMSNISDFVMEDYTTIGDGAYAGVFGCPFLENDMNEAIYNTTLSSVRIGKNANPVDITGDYAFAGAFQNCSVLSNVKFYISGISGNKTFYCAFQGGGPQQQQQGWPALVLSFDKLTAISGQKTFYYMFGWRAFYKNITIHFPNLTGSPHPNTGTNMFRNRITSTNPGITIYCKSNMTSYFNNQVSNMGASSSIQIIGSY